MATTTATKQDLGAIEAQLTAARMLLIRTGADLRHIGHDDLATEIGEIATQIRQVRMDIREQLAN